ncbi:BnaA09g15950D [Brassica napus]|uniref:BnaA09g15950D protein n=1 Tax=Brassica napus TaxID=3708 RepID=A0A078HV21_BRANA|nr:BnaA09g15950D [Brassica napus]
MAPMAPGAWPLFGHLSFFKSSKPTHVTFGDMVEVLGPVFMMKLGSYNVLIISSQEVAKECFTVHDKVIDRIDLTASKILGYDGSFLTFSSCGPYWKEMRKIATWELISTTTTDKFKDSREREVDMTFRDLYMRWEQEGGAKTGVL